MIPYSEEELEEMAASVARGVIPGQPRKEWSPGAREAYERLENRLPPTASLKRLADTSHRAAVATVTRVIDDRPCDPLDAADVGWWSAEDDVGCS